jgi:long-chain fatty acid transport protein
MRILSYGRFRQLLIFTGLVSTSSLAMATNGAMLTGNGPAASGMGGVSIALPQDATAAADNPAGMADVGTRVDLYGVTLVAASNSTFGSPENHLFGRVIMPSPGFGFNYQVAPQWTFGVSVTGAGLDTDYGRPALPLPDAGIAKASLIVVNTSPTVTYKPLPNLAIGASLILGLQEFRASGVLGAGPDGPIALESHGNSWAGGVGAATGVLWTPVHGVNVGASYYTKTFFTPLSGYKDDLLSTSGGHLDSPSRYGVGISINPISGLTLAADYMRILWGGAAGYNNPAFDWHDQNVVRVGAAYAINERWTVRVGYSVASSYFDSNHTLGNFYANGIDDHAVTAGVTYSLNPRDALTLAVEYGIPRTVTGTGPSTGTNISTNFQAYTLGYSHKF